MKTDGTQVVYVLSGRVEVWADETTVSASAGAFIVVPRGTEHGLRRLSDDPVRMLTLISPPGFEKIFSEVARIGEEELLADQDRLLAPAEKYATKILGDYPVPGHA